MLYINLKYICGNKFQRYILRGCLYELQRIDYRNGRKNQGRKEITAHLFIHKKFNEMKVKDWILFESSPFFLLQISTVLFLRGFPIPFHLKMPKEMQDVLQTRCCNRHGQVLQPK